MTSATTAASSATPPDPQRDALCRDCGESFTYPVPESPVALRLLEAVGAPTRCAECDDVARQIERQETADREFTERCQRQGAAWDALCPPLYRATDPARLPGDLMAAADGWTFGPRGLGFIGPSGKCKTRVMMRLCHRLAHEHGKRIAYLTAAEFSHRVSRLAADKMADLDAFLEGLCKASVFFLDDFGKGRLTDRVESELYHVVETRTAQLRPILFTGNGTRASLAALMSLDRGEPILRRLEEFCDVEAVD